jgi:hypothetical protein
VFPRDIVLVTATSYPATAGLTYVFAHDAIAEWWLERPTFLIAIMLVGLLLSILGAWTPHYLRLRPIAITSKITQYGAGCAFGLALGLIGGAIGWLTSDTNVWAVLPAFFLVPLVSGSARIMLPKDETHAG